MNEQVVQIANRIRELRDVLEMRADELAEQLGICVEDYERYESAQTDIPIGILYGIAAICHVDPTLLLTGLPPKMHSYSLAKKGTGVSIERFPGYRFCSLATNFINREMEPMIVTIEPTGGEPKEWFCHSGQEFNLVLSGRMMVRLGEHELVLEEGDSLYFDPRMSHTQIALDAPATFLTVINEQATAYGNVTRLSASENRLVPPLE
ncbi:MAG: XRE family transcriptional regulator [Angelakisella sp.]